VELGDPFDSIAGDERSISVRGEVVADDGRIGLVVLDDQDGLGHRPSL